MSHENVEIVKRLHPGSDTDLVALSRDSAAWAAVTGSVTASLEPDFELEVVGGLLGERTSYSGVAGFRDFWLDWLAPWETYHDELEETLDLGDEVLLLGRHRGTREKTGPEVSVPLLPSTACGMGRCVGLSTTPTEPRPSQRWG